MNNDATARQEKENQFMFLSYPVYVKGSGKGVILMHEQPGLTPECLQFADWLVEAGFRVYLPLFFGKPNESFPGTLINFITVPFCLRQEFGTFAVGKSSPITDWLRKLCKHIHQEYHPKDDGIGVIGMCVTGGFVLAMMVQPSVVAPVISQPALPYYGTPSFKFKPQAEKHLGVSKSDLKKAQDRKIPVLGMRFEEDWISPCARFEELKQAFSPDRQGEDLNINEKNPEGFPFSDKPQFYHYVISADQRKEDGISKGLFQPHSVLTQDHKDHQPDKGKTSTERAREWVKAFLKARLG